MDGNVLKNYDWTTIPKGSGLRENAPHVHLVSFKINASDSLNRIKSYLNLASGQDAIQFYDSLYSSIATQDTEFYLPFFGDAVRSFTNEYGDTFQASFMGAVDSALNAGAKMIGSAASMNVINNTIQGFKNIASGTKEAMEVFGSGGLPEMGKAFGGQMGKDISTAPGSYIETPKLYQYGENDSSLNISFVLSNTINSDSVSKNEEFIKEFTRINRPTRKSPIIMEPPRIYRVKLPGIRYIHWAYCSSFSVSLLGTKRMIGGKITPEGYLISIDLTSLTSEVSNFMDLI